MNHYNGDNMIWYDMIDMMLIKEKSTGKYRQQ